MDDDIKYIINNIHTNIQEDEKNECEWFGVYETVRNLTTAETTLLCFRNSPNAFITITLEQFSKFINFSFKLFPNIKFLS